MVKKYDYTHKNDLIREKKILEVQLFSKIIYIYGFKLFSNFYQSQSSSKFLKLCAPMT